MSGLDRIERAEQKEHINLIKHQGGRSPKLEVKENIKEIMRNLKYATPKMIQKDYIQKTNINIDYHTIRKYVDLLVDEKFLIKEVISDNINLVKQGVKKVRRQILTLRIVGSFST